MSGVRGDGVGVLFVDATDLVERAIRGAVLLLFRAGSVAAVPSVEVRGSTKTVKFEVRLERALRLVCFGPPTVLSVADAA